MDLCLSVQCIEKTKTFPLSVEKHLLKVKANKDIFR